MAHGYIRQICEMQEELAQKVGVVKKQFEAPPSDGLFDMLKAKYYDAFARGQADRGQAGPGRSLLAN